MSTDRRQTTKGVNGRHPAIAREHRKTRRAKRSEEQDFKLHAVFRSRLVSFCILFVVFGVVGWTSYDFSPRTGVIGWYTTFVWTLPIFAVMAGIVGAVITVRTSRPHQYSDSAAIVSEFLIVVVPTIGRSDTVEALERVVTSFCTHLPKHFTSVRVDIVIEESCDARDRITLLTSHQVKVSIITVPTAYRTRNGTQFKARANHYAHELS